MSIVFTIFGVVVVAGIFGYIEYKICWEPILNDFESFAERNRKRV